ncbi:alpha/beta fold hydrolase [Terricaulis sp.]|uniref:alpha/beta fold hydrolase n=1 Tax=Terricaulis sp. TaxID=2768686 RepID=UPI0037834DA4
MIAWLAAAALAAVVAGLLLHLNARAYARRAEARWPAEGRFIEAEGARLHVLEAGPTRAQRVLLIHGASANLRELWHPLADSLATDHRVIAFDRPGYGHSTRPRRGAHKLAAQAQMAAAVLRAAGDGPAIVVGHSLGGAVALRLALDFPALVSGLVLIAPAGNTYDGDNAWWARLSAMPVLGHLFCGLIVPWVGPIAGQAGIANNFRPAHAPATYYEDAGVGLVFRPLAFRSSAIDVTATKAEFAAQAPRYPDIYAPTIIVASDADYVVSTKRHAHKLAGILPAAELVTAPGAGHMPHRLRTDLVLTAIRRVNAMASAESQG